MEQISYRVKCIFSDNCGSCTVFAYSLTGTCNYRTLLSALLCASKTKTTIKKTAGLITYITLNADKAGKKNSVGIQRIECSLWGVHRIIYSLVQERKFTAVTTVSNRNAGDVWSERRRWWIRQDKTQSYIRYYLCYSGRHFNMILSLFTTITGCYTDVTSDGRTRTCNKRQPKGCLGANNGVRVYCYTSMVQLDTETWHIAIGCIQSCDFCLRVYFQWSGKPIPDCSQMIWVTPSKDSCSKMNIPHLHVTSHL